VDVVNNIEIPPSSFAASPVGITVATLISVLNVQLYSVSGSAQLRGVTETASNSASNYLISSYGFT
jgi:hypothetical protein